MMYRSLILVCWLAVLLIRGDHGPLTAVLALALAAVWTVALLRDKRLRLTSLETRGAGIR
ncbi:hypothetical protein [Actinoplanes sp. URMC 104]|uniref:hypothetical protein n=1 Tax=Actinoplanes sp. URMC 104 TaxID=3423409 RepID=UPI003F1D578C